MITKIIVLKINFYNKVFHFKAYTETAKHNILQPKPLDQYDF